MLAETIIELVRALRIEAYVLLGWSMGGHAAIEALNDGATPKGLVLTGTPPCGPDPAEIAGTFFPLKEAAVMSNPHPTYEELQSYLDLMFAPSAPDSYLRRMAKRADGRLRQRLFEHLFTASGLTPQRQTVAKTSTPIAVIQGRLEPFFDPTALDSLEWGNLWRGRSQWIERAGHAPFFTQPQAYAEKLRAFLDDVG